ncbi:enoyl-CoA hydratase/isomerase family protein [Actinomadura parmotrematis]|uniref:Enoyl-CoA hydratase/isomerase family protein n=1 Tax=Actinomadura parmotrematis TaxID=2864039 RepID=A0ABS7FQL4_9ACTN|nr:enoyl-CoA hydratase/isomerase family protein [Actinomadura parmotrematis]MBW8482698.1 enoyl-CoA hydratase/isomerase family protein [Actinomadura parmotrematis]
MADLADGALAADVLGGPVPDPLAVVDLDGDHDARTVESAARRAEETDRVLVGVTVGTPPPSLARAMDLSLGGAPASASRYVVAVPDVGAALGLIAGTARKNPQAALVLRRVLRTTGELPVPAALDVESFAYSTLLGGAEFARWLEARGQRPAPPEAAEPVLIGRAGDRLRVTLNRPERRNAYGRHLRDALTDALRVALLDPQISRVDLDGAGPAFCSGGDLDEFGTAPDLATAHFLRTRAGAAMLLHRLAEQGRTVHAFVHGPCVGAGIELPAFAHRVTARADAAFRLPEIAMGLIPGAGGTVGVPRRIGRWRTAHLALTGQAIDARTAACWGLVDAVRA